jgi:hypothetical protein
MAAFVLSTQHIFDLPVARRAIPLVKIKSVLSLTQPASPRTKQNLELNSGRPVGWRRVFL